MEKSPLRTDFVKFSQYFISNLYFNTIIRTLIFNSAEKNPNIIRLIGDYVSTDILNLILSTDVLGNFKTNKIGKRFIENIY